jgi:hypothetical protein
MSATFNLPKQNCQHFPLRAYLLTVLLTSLWVHASETWRYLGFVVPMTREAFAMVPNVAPWNLPVFLLFGVWDTVLVALTVLLYWLYGAQFGFRFKSIVVAGTLAWTFFFVLFWVGNVAMGMARPQILAIVLPWSWLETVISCAIAHLAFRWFETPHRAAQALPATT